MSRLEKTDSPHPDVEQGNADIAQVSDQAKLASLLSGEDESGEDELPSPVDPEAGDDSFEYSFPGVDCPVLVETQISDLVRRLTELVASANDWRGRGYTAVRSEFCNINLALNRQCLLAPAFRPMIVPKFRVEESERVERDTISRDRQFIDLDWLANLNVGVQADDTRFASMISPGTLNRELAEQFAMMPWKACAKATILGLPEIIQLQMTTLRSKKIKDHFQNVKKPTQRVDRPALIDAQMNCLINVDEFDVLGNLSMARRLGPDFSMLKLARLHGFICGHAPLSIPDLEAALTKLDLLLAEPRAK